MRNVRKMIRACWLPGVLVSTVATAQTTAVQPRTGPGVAATSELAVPLDTGPIQAGAAVPVAQDGGIADIVVTAQRQAQSLQKTPISVAAFTGESLRESGVQNVQQLAQLTPALSVKSDFGATNPNIYIRGVGIGDFNANVTGTVAVYDDEVYVSSPAGQLFQFFDLDRVEVLRGPQGTLYGRNSTGGAINVLSKRPSDAFTADLRALYGRFNEVEVEGGIGGPLADGLDARVSGIYRRRDGYIRNLQPDPTGTVKSRNADVDNFALRGQLLFKPTSNLELLLNGHYGKSDTTGQRLHQRGIYDPSALARGQLQPCGVAQLDRGVCVDALGYAGPVNPDEIRENTPSREIVDAWGTNLRAKLAFGGYSLVSITALERSHRLTPTLDGDDSPNSVLDASYDARYRQFTQELRLSSPTSGRFRWVAGGFYFHEDLDFNGSFDLFRSVRPAIAATARTLTPTQIVALGPQTYGGLLQGFNPGGGPALAGLLGNPVFLFPAISPLYVYQQRVESEAGFGQAYFDITTKLTATVGVRYSHETRRFDYQSTLIEPFGRFPVATNSAALGNNRTQFNDFSFRGAFEYHLTDRILGFASVSRGSKSGGFNGAVLLDQSLTTPFRDEKLTAYELGVKSDFLNRRLRINLTGFYYDYHDLQVYTLLNTGGVPQQFLSNAPVAEVYGGEIEVVARPTRRFTISSSVSLLSSRFAKSFIGPNGADLKGNRLGYAPPFSGTATARYELPLAGGASVVLSGDVSHVAGTFTEATNQESLRTQSGTVVNLRADYRLPGGRFVFGVFGKNVGNDRYITNYVDVSNFGFNRVGYSEPATYGVQVRYGF